MGIGTEKRNLLAASAGSYEYGYGQTGPGYTTVSGFALGTSDWYSSCGNGGGGTWSWSEPVCPTQIPDSPTSFGGYHGEQYRNQPNGGTMQWAFSNDGASWTNCDTVAGGLYFSNTCGTGWRNYYCNNDGEVFATYWRCTGSATCRWDFSLNLYIKW